MVLGQSVSYLKKKYQRGLDLHLVQFPTIYSKLIKYINGKIEEENGGEYQSLPGIRLYMAPNNRRNYKC